MTQQDPQTEAKIARQAVVNKQRRVVFNDDTYELSRSDANTPEGFLKRRLEPLAGTHVDTISFSVLGAWADAPVYDSRVQPIYGDAHGGPPAYFSDVTANVKALIKTGRCPLQIVIDFAHGNGMELFASVRMNDCHDSFIPGGVTIWKKQHPELMVDSDGVPPDKVKHPLGLYVTAQDFSHEQVRQRKFEIIEEVCRRYDIDGLSLNYMRHPVFFSRIMQGLPATVEEVQIMTSFMRRIRGFTDEVAALRGRPLLLSAIVPDNLQLSLNIGLDVKTWLEEDLLDIVIPGLGYAPFTLPVEQWTELAHHYNVPVYPCINKQAPWQVSNDAITEGIRAVAANWYRAGADGIHFWNLGTPFEGKAGQELIDIRQRYYTCLKEVGDPKMLIGKDKLFCADHPVLSYYTHVSSQPPLPVVLKEDVVQCVPLVVADDFGAARNRGPVAVLELQIILKGQVRKEALVFRLNDKLLTDGKFVNAHILYYSLSASQLKTGKNIIEASLKSTAASAVQLQGLQLKTEYKADK